MSVNGKLETRIETQPGGGATRDGADAATDVEVDVDVDVDVADDASVEGAENEKGSTEVDVLLLLLLFAAPKEKPPMIQ